LEIDLLKLKTLMQPIAYFRFVLMLLVTTTLQAQNYSIQKIHDQQQFYLNSTTRTDFGLGDNKTYLAIELPLNTKEWYYSFTAVQNESNQTLNLFSQLANLYDKTGALSLLMESIVVPEGNIRANILLTDYDNAMAFNNGKAYRYWPSYSRENYTEGVVKVTTIRSGTVYLCFRNPNALDGVTISVEVSALVGDKSEQEQAWDDLGEAFGDLIEEIQESKEAKQKSKKKENEWLNYWSTGWILYENEQFDQSIIYTQKAIDIANHPGLCFNMGIAKWAKDSTDCLPDYLEGLNMLYDLETKEQAITVLESALKDFRDSEERFDGFKRHNSSYLLLEAKLNEISRIKSWRRKE
jgi:tetratricopeptide (TPR) repeat protein